MRIFEKGNWSHGAKCPICGTNKDGQVCLVAKSGTEEDNIAKAIQVHINCIELWYKKVRHNHSVIIMGFDEK